VELSANQEGLAHLTRGLALLETQPDSGGEERRMERAQQEFSLQLALGLAWTGPEGYGPQVKKAFTRARELCQRIGKTSQLCRAVGELSIYHYVRAEHRKARELAEEALTLARRVKDPLLVAPVRAYLGFILFCLGEYMMAWDHLERVIAFYNPEQHHRSFVSLRGSDAGLSALAYGACCLWSLGYPEQALKQSQEALALARELGHPFSLIDVLCFAGCVFNAMRRDTQALDAHAEELHRLATEMLPGWLGQVTRFRGEALAKLGHLEVGIAQMRTDLALQRPVVERCYQSETLGSLAEAQANAGQPEDDLSTVAEALAFVEETDERYCEAELYRLQAELPLMQGDEAEAEASLHKAIDVARRQQAKSWELRATTSLARLWQEQGRVDEARLLLAEIYVWFTEGFDTRDLQEAKALLEELS
jgi:adenylate cyclase